MKSCVRSGVAVGAALAIIAIAGSASAATLVNTSTPNATGPASKAFLSGGVATNLVQRIVLTTAASISQISFFGGGTDIDLFLTNAVGPGASDAANVLWSVESFTATGTRGWRDFSVSGLNLNAGTYYLVMGSDNASGGNWTRVSRTDANALGVQARGAGTYAAGGGEKRSASVVYTFEEENTTGFAVHVEGTPIPAPGAAGVLALAGLAGLRRRRA